MTPTTHDGPLEPDPDAGGGGSEDALDDTFDLPLGAAADEARLGASAPVAGAKLRVLVVEDDDITRSLMCSVLRAAEFEVVEATDGEAGLDAARTELPDVIFIDGRLPRRDGVDVAREIRADRTAASQATIIVVSARALRRDVERAFDAGVDEYVVKPFDPDGLVRITQSIADGTFHPAPQPLSPQQRSDPEADLLGDRAALPLDHERPDLGSGAA